MTAAALVRCIDAQNPTIFLDEMDAQLRSSKEYAEAVRGILNEGFHKGGKFYKCHGDKHELRTFNAYCPKCFAGIGQLPETVASRSIVIEMRRKKDGEQVQPLRERAVREASSPIRLKLEAWKARGVSRQLEKIHPDALPSLGDRQNDIAEPLLCIATLAGPDLLRRVSDALLAVMRGARSENVSIGVNLLRDIKTIFCEQYTEKMFSGELTGRLQAIEGRPWADWPQGKGFTPNVLARLLGKYHVAPHSIRKGSKTGKGYDRANFDELWQRYCPEAPLLNVTSSQPAPAIVEATNSTRHSDGTQRAHDQTHGISATAGDGLVTLPESGSRQYGSRNVTDRRVRSGCGANPRLMHRLRPARVQRLPVDIWRLSYERGRIS